MKRKLVKIDEEKCDGCGLCASACAEGAIQIVGGKAKLVNEAHCDGLGACLGECQRGALSMEERETAPDHGRAGCPSATAMDFGPATNGPAPDNGAPAPSALSHWPVQLRLASAAAPHFRGADVVLAADCVAYALGNFHAGYLKGRRLAIACPKLDADLGEYEEKLKQLIDQAGINTLTVMVMRVPCCAGLLALARRAAQGAGRKVPIKAVVVGLKGEIVSEERI
ncbi:MAG: 4Fe-4S binding protein [Elusimicrobia bacterium]|nr:4Fe-4S binding protein [Elusimicrobiota bacterium]